MAPKDRAITSTSKKSNHHDIDKNMAKGLVGLYDDSDNDLASPIWKENKTTTIKQSYGTGVDNNCGSSNSHDGSDNVDQALEKVHHTSTASSKQVKSDAGLTDFDETTFKFSNIDLKSIQIEWLGTAELFLEARLEIQKRGLLDNLIRYREALIHDIGLQPYDPSRWIDLCRLYNKLGFTELATAAAHKSLLLVQAGLGIHNTKETFPRDLDALVRKTMRQNIRVASGLIVKEQLINLHVRAYRELLHSLLGCSAFSEGLLIAEKAVAFFPKDPDLVDSLNYFRKMCKELKEVARNEGIEEDILPHLKWYGRIYPVKYPWLDSTLFSRTASLVANINCHLNSADCEVRSMVFGQGGKAQRARRRRAKKWLNGSDDVGPLGLFAKVDIPRGAIVMVDNSLMGISDVPSSKLQHCDACHASLCKPFLNPNELSIPTCCKAVAYCSAECRAASISYHAEICGRDWNWMYEKEESLGNHDITINWQARMFLRAMALVLADIRHTGEHPLQHNIIARMLAHYTSPANPECHKAIEWEYLSDVVAPLRILTMMNIDIFRDQRFSHEVIQTIYRRFENNAHFAAVDPAVYRPELIKEHKAKARKTGNVSTARSVKTQGDDNNEKIAMVSLNTSHIFFNHSCDPNVMWYGAIPNPYVYVNAVLGDNEEILAKPGSSTILAVATRDIKKGEELRISYIGDPTGDDVEGREAKKLYLTKWFDGGCGCNLCIREVEEEARVSRGM